MSEFVAKRAVDHRHLQRVARHGARSYDVRSGKTGLLGQPPRVSTRSQLNTFQYITDHTSPTDHYRHISPLRNVMRRPAPGEGVTCRRVLESHRYRWLRPLALGLVVAGVAPPAAAEPCTGAAAEAQPPAAPNASATPAMPGSTARRSGTGRRKANDSAPLPTWAGCRGRSSTRSCHSRSACSSRRAVVPPPAPPRCPGCGSHCSAGALRPAPLRPRPARPREHHSSAG